MPNTLGVTGSSAIDPAISILSSAVAWWDASSYSGGQTLTNQGVAGSFLSLQLGSTGSSDSNDPTFLDHSGTNYLSIYGGGSYFRVWTPNKCTQYRATPLVGSPVTGAVTKGYSNHFNYTGVGSWKKFELLDADSNVLVTYDWPRPYSNVMTPVETIGNNLLEIQSGYETGSSGWTTTGPVNPASAHGRSTDRSYAGTYSYKVVAPGSTNFEGVYNPNFVSYLKPSTSYTVTGRVYVDPSSTTDVGISVRNVLYENAVGVTIATKGSWVPFSLTSVSNIENEGGGVVPGLEMWTTTSAVTGTATWYLDDLSVVETTPTPRPGTIVGISAKIVTSPTFVFSDDFLTVGDASLLNVGSSDGMTILADFDYVPFYNLFGVTSDAVGGSPSGFFGGLDSHGSGPQLHVRIKDDSGNIVSTGGVSGSYVTNGEKVVGGFILDRDTDTMSAVHKGVVVASVSSSSVGAISNTAPFYIGAYLGSGIYTPFAWRRTAIFDRALTPEEVAAVTEYWSR